MSNLRFVRALTGLATAALVALPLPAFAFGALAIESNHGGNVGWAHDYSTQDEANERALQECGPGCTVVLHFWNGCAAYSTDQDKGSTVFGWGTGTTRAEAESAATSECGSHGGESCAIKVWSCE